jgi:hypothetical protein
VRTFKKSALAVIFVLGITCAAGAQINDTINGVVTDSLTAAIIDSVDVASGGVSVQTKPDGTFTLIFPTTPVVQSGKNNLHSQQIVWNPKTSEFAWQNISGDVSIRIHNVQGQIASQFSSMRSSKQCRFSIAGLPDGMYIATIITPFCTEMYRIVHVLQGSAGLSNMVTRISGAGPAMLAAVASTTTSHSVTCTKNGYVVRTATIAAGTSTGTRVSVKLFPSVFNAPWDWSGVVGTGQSLAVGDHGTPVKSTTQPYHNLKLSTGTLSWPVDPNNAALTMVPLIEPIERSAPTYPSSWPTNISGETAHSSMGNQITSLFQAATGRDYINVHGEFGENGQCMIYLKKNATQSGVNGRAFAATVVEVKATNRLALAAGKTYGIGAIIITHGECDATNTTYENDLHQLWSDYNTDLRAITGQTQNIQMFVSQQQSIGNRSPATLAQWKVGVDYPATIVCSGPKYQYTYAADSVHLINTGYQQLGEKYGQVYFQRIILGNNWKPLQPTTIERSGTILTVHFHVPVLPLVWETTFQAPHQNITEWKQGKGFEVTTSGGTKVTINSVAISGDAVIITCASDPGASAVVGYAMVSEPTHMRTPFSGTVHWGLLRDSDPFVGTITKKAQPNYGVAFEMIAP